MNKFYRLWRYRRALVRIEEKRLISIFAKQMADEWIMRMETE